jgi:hypothetical protein
MRWSILRQRLGFIDMLHGLPMIFRWAVTFLIVWIAVITPAKADQWALPETEVHLSANGQFRFTVVPRDLNSQLDYFEAKVKDEKLPDQLAPSGKLEQLLDGQWSTIW